MSLLHPCRILRSDRDLTKPRPQLDCVDPTGDIIGNVKCDLLGEQSLMSVSQLGPV